MPKLFFLFERRARFLMGGVALLTVLALVLFKTHLIELQPSYDAYGWYTVNDVNPAMTITRRMDNESVCRESARLEAIGCMQGKFLNTKLVAATGSH